MSRHRLPRLRSSAELRSYVRRLITLSRGISGERFWIVIGDFDHFKHFNDLYGKPIIDYLHGKAKDLIEKRMAGETLNGSQATGRCLFLGDEVIAVLPRSRLAEDDIRVFLDSISRDIRDLFHRQYMVAALSIEGGNWEYRAPQESGKLGRKLRECGIIMDQAPRKKGYLLLIKLEGEGVDPSLELGRAAAEVESYIRDSDAKVRCTLEWVFNRERGSYQSVNDGWLLPLSLSWGAVSSGAVQPAPAETGVESGFSFDDEVDRLLETVHHTLHQSKKSRRSVTISACRPEGEKRKAASPVITLCDAKPYCAGKTKYPIVNDDCLNRVISELSAREKAGTLIQFEKSYLAGAGSQSGGAMKRVGLKAINDSYGYDAGDCVIHLLESVFHDELRRFCRARRISRANVHISRFVDVFTIYFFNTHIAASGIERFASMVFREFNTRACGISLASLTAFVVHNREKLRGSELARRLAVTALSSKTSLKDELTECITVREYSASCEEKAMEIIELNAARSALRLS
jgi:GGDEF domain-containing protein